MEAVQAVPVWQVMALIAILSWLRFSAFTSLTVRLRSILQPLVTSQVRKGTVSVLRIQRFQHRFWDVIFAVASSAVSVEFYTAFLPLLFWSGHTWLARHMVFLMALCIYVGNCVKDVVSAPRPGSPPVRRLIAIKCEEESAMEFGLPSSHTINTICLSLYLFIHFSKQFPGSDPQTWWLVMGFTLVMIVLVAIGRLYLGMHTPIDVYAGVPIGLFLLSFWCFVDDHVDQFVTQGENVLAFSTSMCFLLLFAYPAAEHKTPSFEFHTAFNGVVLGVIYGTHRFYSYGQDPTTLTVSNLEGTILLAQRSSAGFPIVLGVKWLCKVLARRLIPSICRAFYIPIRSSSYVPSLQGLKSKSTTDEEGRNLWLRLLPVGDEDYLDVDTGIRLIQYAALGWSVSELVPYCFQSLGL